MLLTWMLCIMAHLSVRFATILFRVAYGFVQISIRLHNMSKDFIPTEQ